MDYISVKEAAELWDVSQRWVQKFCAEDRIPNVIRFGRSWMIPKDAVRPDDLRKKASAENICLKLLKQLLLLRTRKALQV